MIISGEQLTNVIRSLPVHSTPRPGTVVTKNFAQYDYCSVKKTIVNNNTYRCGCAIIYTYIDN